MINNQYQQTEKPRGCDIGRVRTVPILLTILFFIGIMQNAAAWTFSNQDNSTNQSMGVVLNGSYINNFSIDISSVSTKNDPYSTNMTGAIIFLKMDENTGRFANDSSGYNNNGTFMGNGSVGFANWTTGKYNSAVLFDGSNDNLTIPHSDIMNSTYNSFAVELWFNLTSLPGAFGHIYDFQSANAAGFELRLNSSNYLQFLTRGGASGTVISTDTVPLLANRDYHVVTSWDGTTQELIVNGASKNTTGRTALIPNHTEPLLIAMQDLGSPLPAKVDNFIMYNRSMSASEASYNYMTRVQQLQVRHNATTTYSTVWNTTANNGLSIPYSANQQIGSINFFVPGIAMQSGITIYDYNKTAIFIGNFTIRSFQLLRPLNTTTTASPVTLQWYSYPVNSPDTYQIATDPQFLSVVTSGTGTFDSATSSYSSSVSLSASTTYYWHAKNSTGSYSDWFTFTTSAPASTPGQLNITVFDEMVWDRRIWSFSAQIYNSTTTVNKSTTNGWVNFSSTEVVSGQYFIIISGNSSYAPRGVLATSPVNVTVYVPPVSATIDTIAFYLLDYTNLFPWASSYLVVSKNNSVMHSSYFDADAKVAAYLVRGQSYTISVYSGSNVQQWGNYISTGSGNVEVVLMDIGVNYSKSNPFTYNLSHSQSAISLTWNSDSNVLSQLNFTIYKGDGKQQVHQIITTLRSGLSSYTVTNLSDVYYVYMTANTTNGQMADVRVIDYRMGTKRTDNGIGYIWTRGSYVTPDWLYNAISILMLVLLAGSFGAMHRGEGAIITGIFAMFFWSVGWLNIYGASAGFLGSLLIFSVLYHLESKRRAIY